MPRIFVVKDPDFVGDENFHGSYTYDRQKREWVFMGYRCIHCEKTFKTSSVKVKHLNTCRGVSRKKEKDEEPPIIFDKKGNEWKPFTESNQY